MQRYKVKIYLLKIMCTVEKVTNIVNKYRLYSIHWLTKIKEKKKKIKK